MKLEHFKNVKDVYEKRRNFQNLMVAKGLKEYLFNADRRIVNRRKFN